ncbi:hypothetical protein EDB84DRAFT_1613857 [Lactarius hengduanensis]|nr:hypothetical protein EDB84DRAFT_1613857 [Lactarius hengduanensis]
MDPTKPYGEACTPNGGLKEAHEIIWHNDPDDVTPISNHTCKRASSERPSSSPTQTTLTAFGITATGESFLSETAESIPLQSLGVVDVTATNVQENEILANALSNVARSDVANGWAIKRSSDFVNEYPRKGEDGSFSIGSSENPNHLLGSFPCLFPYGEGGFEVNRKHAVSYESHARWSIRYEDKRFRKDHHFIFLLFGVLQKRQLCAAAVLQISKRSFLLNERAIRNLKPSDFCAAAAEEQARKPFSNPVIQSLRRNLSTVRAKSYVARIVDLDCFDASDHNPSNGEIAADPYAAASFFHLMVNAILEALLGITICASSGPIKRETGILGDVDACIGTVEAQANIRADLSDVHGTDVLSIPRESRVSFSRPIDPRSPHYDDRQRNAERRIARTVQVHQCSIETKDIAWYITHYVAKKQNSSSNISALLTKTLAFHRTKERLTNDLKTINKRLIQRCGNALSREQELSAPEVISYLMGWGDRFISHRFETIHWHSVVQLLKQTYPILNTRPSVALFFTVWWYALTLAIIATDNTYHTPCMRGHMSPAPLRTDDNTVNIQMVEGRLLFKDQIREYLDRGEALLSWNFLDYFLGTYDGRFLKERTSARGRPSNIRVPYREGSNRDGQWFPKRDEADPNGLFFACMLALLKPWASLTDLKGDTETFQHAFHDFASTAPDDTLATIANIEFYHECSESARRHTEAAGGTDHDNEQSGYIDGDFEDVSGQQILDVDNDNRFKKKITDDEILKAIDRPFAPRELLHTDIAVNIGTDCGALADLQYSVAYCEPARPATATQLDLFPHWQTSLDSGNVTIPEDDPMTMDEDHGVAKLDEFTETRVYAAAEPSFPPIANVTRELYNAQPNDNDCLIGRHLFEQFDIVIRLEEQMRVFDSGWNDILHRARTGDCTNDDISEINKLVLGTANCAVPDFANPPWNDTILVTPRNAVQALWNEKMLEQHCRKTGHTHYVLYAMDSCRTGQLTKEQRFAIAQLKMDKTGRLPGKINLAIGMKAMLLANTAPHMGLANGTRGVIDDIILDPREPLPGPDCTHVQLSFPPAAVLFKPFGKNTSSVPGLPEGVLPLFPTEQTFKIGAKPRVTIHRQQFALTPAYAFTDIKSQGQMLECVIVDIAKPPSGSLTGFNAYVALSRSRGRDTIRLLRDFDPRLFTVHPSEQLRNEDDRLAALETATLLRYRSGEFGSFCAPTSQLTMCVQRYNWLEHQYDSTAIPGTAPVNETSKVTVDKVDA